jgi:hypothetical protein
MAPGTAIRLVTRGALDPASPLASLLASLLAPAPAGE